MPIALFELCLALLVLFIGFKMAWKIWKDRKAPVDAVIKEAEELVGLKKKTEVVDLGEARKAKKSLDNFKLP